MKKQTMCAMVVVLALGALANPLAGFQGKGSQEGVKVHGHWVIDVRQPDGTLVTHREFKNALKPFGAQALAFVLARAFLPKHWEVIVGPSGACTMDGLPTGQQSSCFLREPAFASGSPYSFSNLTVASTLVDDPRDDDPATQVFGTRLHGTATAHRNATITRVDTRLMLCQASTTTIGCANETNFQYDFSGTTVPVSNTAPVINVVPGQLIQVTVTFTFS